MPLNTSSAGPTLLPAPGITAGAAQLDPSNDEYHSSSSMSLPFQATPSTSKYVVSSRSIIVSLFPSSGYMSLVAVPAAPEQVSAAGTVAEGDGQCVEHRLPPHPHRAWSVPLLVAPPGRWQSARQP